METTSKTACLKSESINMRYVWLICVVAAMGGLLFGYDFVVIGGAKPFFERFFHLEDAATSGWANSCALLGCLAGALLAGMLSDKFGRKKLLILSAFLFAVTSIGIGLVNTFNYFVFWRILGGVAIGLASNLSPMYIAEAAPASMRGKLVSINQLTIVVGILLAQFVNWFIVRDLPRGATEEFMATSWYVTQGWRWMFYLTAVPSMVFLISMFFVPESPRWLAKNGKFDSSQKILSAIGGPSYAAQELAEIKSTLVNDIGKVRFSELLDLKMFRIITLGVFLAVFQQWCGINVIFNYAEEIFRSAGYDISDVLKNIAWTGSVNLLFTFVALKFVDKSGRRPLMLFGAAGLALIFTTMGFFYFYNIKGLPLLLLVLATIGCFAMSLGPVTWVVISEIFPNRIRGAAMSIAVASLWVACFVLTYTFPILNKWLGSAGTFWIYAGISVIGFFGIGLTLTETKGKTLEEIEHELMDK